MTDPNPSPAEPRPAPQADSAAAPGPESLTVAGDLELPGALADRAVVRVGGNLTVRGLIGAADVQVGGDCCAGGGIAAKGLGRLVIGGRLVARYLDQATGTVRRDVAVAREMMNCHLAIGGALSLPQGPLLGGEIRVTGQARLHQLGNPAATPTVLHLGSAPAIEAVLQAVAAALARMSPALQRLEEQIAGSSATLGLTAARRERLTELWCEKDLLADQIKRLQAKQHAALTQFEAARAVDLGVTGALHAGVTLVAEEQAAVFTQTLEGPLWIGWDERRQLVVKPKGGDYPVPIARYAQLRASPRVAPPVAAAA